MLYWYHHTKEAHPPCWVPPALYLLSSLAGSRNGGIPITLILVGALYLSQQVYDILFVQDNVANFMHIVGGACGTVFGFAVRRK